MYYLNRVQIEACCCCCCQLSGLAVVFWRFTSSYIGAIYQQCLVPFTLVTSERFFCSKHREQNSRGQRRQRQQNNKTNYRRQKAHVNMWNKADIRAVLLSNETSTAPFPRCLQNVVDISRTSNVLFRRRRWSQRNFSENRNTRGNQSKDMLSKVRGLRPKRGRQHFFPLVALFMSIFPQISLPLRNVWY